MLASRLRAPAAASGTPGSGGDGSGRVRGVGGVAASSAAARLASRPCSPWQPAPLLLLLAARRRNDRVSGPTTRPAAAAGAKAAAAAADDADANDDDDEGEDEYEDDDEEMWDEDEDEDEYEEGDEYEDEYEEEGDEEEEIQAPEVLSEWQEADFVEVARVTRPFGVRGELRVTPTTDEPRRRLGRRGVRLWLLPPLAAGAAVGGRRPPLTLAVVRGGRQVRPERRGGRPGSAAWAVRLHCAPDRESAERLAGCTLMMRASEREELPGDDGDFYVQELVGMDVVAAAQSQALVASGKFTPGALVGRVIDVLPGTGSHDTLRVRLAPTPADVRRSRYRTALVPFCEAIVPECSRSERRMALDPPEGLLEATAQEHRMRRAYTAGEVEALLAKLQAEGVRDDEEEAAAAERAKNSKKGKGGGRRGGGGRKGGGGGGGGGGAGPS